MSRFGKTAFAGSPFLFWTLGPCFLLVSVALGFLTCKTILDHNVKAAAICGTLTVVSLCAVLMLFNPQRFSWAGRAVAATIFAAYVYYAVDEIFYSGHPWNWGGRRSATNPVNAILGLIVIGGPCLWFTLFGRFSLKREHVPVPRPCPTGLAQVKVIGPAPRIERPLHTSEAAIIQERTSVPSHVENLWRRLVWVALWSAACMAGIAGFFWFAGRVETGPQWMGMAMGLCFLFPIFTFYAAYANLRAYFELRKAARRWKEQILPQRQAALENAMASVVQVEATKVILIEEEEWGEAAMLFELADGNTLFLHGGDYFPPEEGMAWPAARFEIVRSAANDQWIRLWTENAPLQPAQVVPLNAMPDEFTWDENCPPSETVLEGSAEENLRRLGYQPGKAAASGDDESTDHYSR